MSVCRGLLAFFLCLISPNLFAADTGKTAAMKYFTPEAKRQVASSGSSSTGFAGTLKGDRILSLSVGSLISTKAYNWGEDSTPGWSVEAAYQWAGSGLFGQGIHVDLQKFALQAEELTKVSLLYSLTFPRRLSFPVFLGVSFGPGYFLKQQENESHFSFDYKAYLGLRLNQVHSQYFVQSGVKNHVNVLSDGQFIGWFVSSGVAYTF